MPKKQRPRTAGSSPAVGWELLLATRIADHILQVGSDPDRPATRIQFKSGLYPDEVSMGGLCRTALVSCIFDAIMARTDYGQTVTIPNITGHLRPDSGRDVK